MLIYSVYNDSLGSFSTLQAGLEDISIRVNLDNESWGHHDSVAIFVAVLESWLTVFGIFFAAAQCAWTLLG